MMKEMRLNQSKTSIKMRFELDTGVGTADSAVNFNWTLVLVQRAAL